MAAARRKSSVLSRSDIIKQMYTLVNKVTGGVDGEAGRSYGFPIIKCFDRAGRDVCACQDLKEGDPSEVVFLRFRLELSSSSLVDEAVVEDTIAVNNARSGFSILKNDFDHYYPLIK